MRNLTLSTADDKGYRAVCAPNDGPTWKQRVFRVMSNAAAMGLCTLGVQAQTSTAFDPAKIQTLPVTELAFGLEHPWALAFLPNGDFLVTERGGTMRVIDAAGRVGAPLRGVPAVVAEGQGGLLDLVLDHHFEQNRQLYFCFSEADPTNSSRNSTALASAKLSEQNDRLENVQVIFHQMPRVRSSMHYGCRIAQADDGSLFLTLGERSIARDQAQRPGNHLGSVVRVQQDGSPHPENPFVNKPGALPETWSWGHRNPQGAVITPDGHLWVHEHGPQGGDELNLVEADTNYGWPIITYGRNYGIGTKIGEGTHKQGMAQPVHYWTPSIAPSGMAYLRSDRYGPQWQHSLFIGSLKFGTLHRLALNGDSVGSEEWFKVGDQERIRDVREGPDGLLYLVTDSRNGRLLRVDPPASILPAEDATQAESPTAPTAPTAPTSEPTATGVGAEGGATESVPATTTADLLVAPLSD